MLGLLTSGHLGSQMPSQGGPESGKVSHLGLNLFKMGKWQKQKSYSQLSIPYYEAMTFIFEGIPF